MLSDAIPAIGRSKFAHALHAFFHSYWYPAIVALLAALSELFAIEIPVYYTYVVLVAICVFFDTDTLGIVPVACCSYMTFAAKNNPYKFPTTTYFGTAQAKFHLAFIALFLVILLLGRLIQYCIVHGGRRVPRLTVGFAALGVAYLVAGIPTANFGWKSVLFGLLQIASLCLFYFYFYFTVNWEEVKEGHALAVFFAVGGCMAIQVFGMYIGKHPFSAEFTRDELFTGWGVYNNVGCMMAMAIPAPFYFAVKAKRFPALYSAAGIFFYLCVILTQSRGAIVAGTAVFLLCIIVTLALSQGQRRAYNLLVFVGALLILATAAYFLRHQLYPVFRKLLETKFNDNGRWDIYHECIDIFKQNPIFGNGFFGTPGVSFVPNFPSRAHDTFFQLLASGGVLALAAYVLHRIQTLVLFFKKPSAEKGFILLCVLALLVSSLFDCHMFNIGPGLPYACLLAFAEGSGFRKKEQ